MESKLEALESLLVEIDSAVRIAMETYAPASGMAAILRQKRDTLLLIHEERNRIRMEEAAQQDAGPVTEDEMVEQAVGELARLPDPLLDRVLSGLVEAGRGPAVRRNAPPGLRVVGE